MLNCSVNKTYSTLRLSKVFNRMTTRIKAFIADNGFQTNLILALGLLAYVIIIIDFDTDIAVQRDEIDYVVAVLSKSLNDAGLDILTIIDFKPPFQGFVFSYNEKVLFSETLEFPTGRAPPSI